MFNKIYSEKEQLELLEKCKVIKMLSKKEYFILCLISIMFNKKKMNNFYSKIDRGKSVKQSYYELLNEL